MNWQAIKFDWTQVRAFVATAELGSLSAAARALGLTQPTLGRQVTALEETLGVTLFERAGRSLRMTQAGRDLLAPAQAMRDAAIGFSLSAEGHTQSIDGRVSITATEFVASRVLPPMLADLRKLAPALEVQVIASNEVQDLTRREADISIRHARPEHPDLIARKIADRRAFLYAETGFLDQVGRPKTLNELRDADIIGFFDMDRSVEIFQSLGLPITAANIRIASDSGAVIRGLAEEGMGFTMMTEDMASFSERLEKVLPEEICVPVPVWLVTHREIHTSRRIRLVFDHLADQLIRINGRA